MNWIYVAAKDTGIGVIGSLFAGPKTAYTCMPVHKLVNDHEVHWAIIGKSSLPAIIYKTGLVIIAGCIQNKL